MPKTTKTLTSAERGVNLFNDARRNSSNEYMRATGEVTVATSISHAMEPIVKYAQFMNEFLHYVVNKIVIAGLIRAKKVWSLSEKIRKEVSGVSVKTSGRDKIIEITDKSATKGKGAQLIANILNINIENTVHIGDSENDTTTLNKVGALIAVKNSSIKLLNVATHIGPNHKRGGVAKILNGEFSEVKH